MVRTCRPGSRAIGVRQENTACAVHHHRARAALAEAAAELGAVQPELVAQDIQQRRVGIGFDVMRAAIHVQPDHQLPPSCRALGIAGARSVQAG